MCQATCVARFSYGHGAQDVLDKCTDFAVYSMFENVIRNNETFFTRSYITLIRKNVSVPSQVPSAHNY